VNEQLTEGDEDEAEQDNAQSLCVHEEQESKADDALHEVRAPALSDSMIRNNVLGALKIASSVGASDSDKELLLESWELYELNYIKRVEKLTAPADPYVVDLHFRYIDLDQETIGSMERLLQSRVLECDGSLKKHGRGEGVDTTSIAYLAKLKQACRGVKTHYDELLKRIERDCRKRFECRCELKLADLKHPKRYIVKARLGYGDDYSCLLDIIRSSFVCDSVADMRTAVQYFLDVVEANADVWKVVRYKNRFAPSYDAAASRGYRDLNLNLRHLPMGIVTEVQFHIRSIFEYGKENDGHKTYERIRCVSGGMLSTAFAL
jgi:hypothetical protein